MSAVAGPLIGPAELRAAEPALVSLLDVRWSLTGPPGRAAYEAGHLPGAVFVNLDRDLAGPAGAGGRHPLPDPEAFVATMRSAGVDNHRMVVVYDQRDGTAAARLWWLLRWFGHADVRLLDGGYDGWVAAGGDVAAGPVAAARPGDFNGEPGAMPTLDADGAGALARDGVLLDARAAARYRGEVEPVDPVAGHVPGAVSAPANDNVGADGRFLAAAELRARFAGLGVAADSPVGAYCGSGVTAAHHVLALELAGIRAAALWPGSWSEWVADPDRPVATGD